MEQSGSKIAIRNMKQFLKSRQSMNDAMKNTDKKSRVLPSTTNSPWRDDEIICCFINISNF